MASLGHVVIALAARRWYERDRSPRRFPLLAIGLWTALSILPDADVVAFTLGIPYSAPWGHRGATHSLAFAVFIGLLAALAARVLRLPVLRTWLLATAVVASHGILDTMTDGGLGCALLWPFSHERFFAPVRPIPVAPIGFDFISSVGLRVAAAELLIFLPAIVYAFWPTRRAVSD
jgi:inner membrane protein